MPALVDFSSGVVTGGVLTVGTGYRMMFCPTARARSDEKERTKRNSSICFMRGYKDTVNYMVSGGGSWTWRRIVFTMKGDRFRRLYDPTDPATTYGGFDTVTGGSPAGIPRRMITPMNGNVADAVEDYIFQGSRNVDWFNQLTAKVDRTHITVLSEEKRSFNPGNDTGKVINLNRWYNFRKNLVYEDYEDQDNIDGGPYSTTARAGMGDVYIWDYVTLNNPSPIGDASFSANIQGTLYWHER